MDIFITILIIWNSILTGIIVADKICGNRDKELREALEDVGVFGNIYEYSIMEDSFHRGRISRNLNSVYKMANNNKIKIDEMSKSTLEKFCENYICGEG